MTQLNPTARPEDQDAPEYFDRREGILGLWFGMLAGPAAWFIHLNVSYSLVRAICLSGGAWLLHLTTFAALVLAAAGVWVSWGSWNRVGRPEETGGEGTIGRARFMAVSGLALSGFFLLTILVAWIPDLILNACPEGL